MLRLPLITTAPVPPPVGFLRLYFDASGQLVQMDPGGVITPIGGGIGGVNYIANIVAPVGPGIGDYWLDTTTNTLKFWDGVAWSVILTPASSIDQLVDVDTTTVPPVTNDSILAWDGINWTPKHGYKFTVANTSPPTPADGDWWYAPAAGDLYFAQGGGWTEVIGNVNFLRALGDVNINLATLTDGQVLQYNGTTGLWDNVTLFLDSLADVVITAPAVGDVITYDGVNFINQQPPAAGPVTVPVAAAPPLAPVNGQLWYSPLTKSLYVYDAIDGAWNS